MLESRWLSINASSCRSREVSLRKKLVSRRFVVFRAADAQTHDAVYFRPFNFRASDPARRDHAVQYVSHPRSPWQNAPVRAFGRIRKAVVPEPDGNRANIW